jgi:signal transduction histidine kinase
VARELHDELGQVLTSLKLEFSWLVDEIRRGDPKPGVRFVNRLQSLIGLIEVSIATVRRISGDLRPAVLDHLGLPAAIQWEATTFEARTGIRCRFASGPIRDGLDGDRAIVVYRILQEALTNVARHAHAGAVRIELRERGRFLNLSVKDNGCGITRAELLNPRSIGLAGMRERARLAGGRVTIEGVRGRGTTVTVRVSLDGTPRRADRAGPGRPGRSRGARPRRVNA